MSFPTSPLSQENILRDIHDPANQLIRTSATLSGATVEVDLDYDTDSVSIGDPVSNNILKINGDGSVDANVAIDSADGDNILVVGTEDGTSSGTKHYFKIGSDGKLEVKDTSSTAVLNSLLTELQQKTEPADIQNTRLLNSATDSVDVPGVATAANQSAQTTILSNINNKTPNLGSAVMANSVPVTIATDQTPIPVTIPAEPLKISGTENGQPSGTEFTFVNSLRNQILAAKDRVQNITYADFGTKNQRVTQIDYSAPSIGSGPGFTARKILNYSLVGVNYRRDSITWTLV